MQSLLNIKKICSLRSKANKIQIPRIVIPFINLENEIGLRSRPKDFIELNLVHIFIYTCKRQASPGCSRFRYPVVSNTLSNPRSGRRTIRDYGNAKIWSSFPIPDFFAPSYSGDLRIRISDSGLGKTKLYKNLFRIVGGDTK